MFKTCIIISLLLLTHCSTPGTALLGPAFTGATTKSIGQASLSFGTNQVVKQVRVASQKSKNEFAKIVQKIEKISNNFQPNNLLEFHN